MQRYSQPHDVSASPGLCFYQLSSLVAATFPDAAFGSICCCWKYAQNSHIIWIGNRFGQEVGLDWEQKLGLITFPIALGGIFLVDIWLREPSSMPDETLTLGVGA